MATATRKNALYMGARMNVFVEILGAADCRLDAVESLGAGY